MRWRTVMLSLAMVGAIGILMPGAAPARASQDSWVVCRASGSVRLYIDEAHTTLVDAFTVVNAPTRHRLGSGDFVVQGDQAGPGVDVVGTVTGTPYVFGFRSVLANSVQNPGGVSASVTWFDWRVSAPGAGIICAARTRWLGIYRDGEPTVVEMVGPVISGLYLSGNLGIICPQF
jgi:hypothetical protein